MKNRDPQKRSRIKYLEMRIGAIAIALTALLLPACANIPETESRSDQNVTTEDVSENAAELSGKTVTIRSEAIEKVDEEGFLVEDEQVLGGEPILVINATNSPFVLPADDDIEVQVTGEVRQLILADASQEYGLDLDPEVYGDYEEQPVIIARSLALAPDPEEITANPEKYYNQLVAVEGEVEKAIDANTFTLDEDRLFGGDDLLVISPQVPPAMQEGETVTVVGILRPYVEAEFERDYDLTWDLDVRQQIEAEYTSKPVFVSQEIYPSAR